ncbi:hypothetical protein M0802_000187 [Mischocyttarus mexicanus]|nr:hypothetical protein M0802_000187 [Mischocyttarus mexicanus]
MEKKMNKKKKKAEECCPWSPSDTIDDDGDSVGAIAIHQWEWLLTPCSFNPISIARGSSNFYSQTSYSLKSKSRKFGSFPAGLPSSIPQGMHFSYPRDIIACAACINRSQTMV